MRWERTKGFYAKPLSSLNLSLQTIFPSYSRFKINRYYDLFRYLHYYYFNRAVPTTNLQVHWPTHPWKRKWMLQSAKRVYNVNYFLLVIMGNEIRKWVTQQSSRPHLVSTFEDYQLKSLSNCLCRQKLRSLWTTNQFFIMHNFMCFPFVRFGEMVNKEYAPMGLVKNIPPK